MFCSECGSKIGEGTKTCSKCGEHLFLSKQDDATQSSPRTLSIGRDPSNDIVLTHLSVSKHHAQILNKNGESSIFDLGSLNGTFVNGKKINRFILSPGDRILIADFTLIFDGNKVIIDSQEKLTRLDAMNLTRVVKGKVCILHDVTLSFLPGELSAIVGASGAGKSTLLKALTGYRRADSGQVLLNGQDLYQEFELCKQFIGYVPQDDIIHLQLTIHQALDFVARLRMPPNTNINKRDEAVERVMKILKLSERKNFMISKLSGGQRKRVSIGVELLTKPPLFFLDEPTSGLDPLMSEEVMDFLRSLADEGSTIILTTHLTSNLERCDYIAFLAKGGYLAFFGTPQRALQYFHVEDYSEIYAKLEKEKKPEMWSQLYRQTKEYETLIEKRVNSVKQIVKSPSAKYTLTSDNVENQTKDTIWRQFRILSKRYFTILRQDMTNLVILLLQAPVLAAILCFLYKPDAFSLTSLDYPRKPIMLSFLLIISGIWLGTTNSIREITKEAPIYERERMVNLWVIPYIGSKLFLLGLLCAIQSAVLTLTVFYHVHLPNAMPGEYLLIYCILFLCSMDGMALGLVVSSLMSNQDRALAFLPFLQIPQIIFSGALTPLKGKVVTFVSYFMISRFGFQLLGKLLKLSAPPQYDFSHVKIALNLAILLFFFAGYAGISCVLQKRKDLTKD
ncbi:MAG: ATP-binding cassette domain-containing protein [Firmicutes bacterium]|nr:ATP-binding cassette domain-containing protein [Bacillota bacterium]